MGFNKNLFKHLSANIYQNAETGLLVEHTLKTSNAKLTPQGALVVYSGKFTGRAAEDKYIVFTEKTEKTIDWNNSVHKMTSSTFLQLKEKVIEFLNTKEKIYYSHRNAGAIEKYSLSVELYTNSPHHSLFFHHLLRHDQFAENGMGAMTVYHAPDLVLDPKVFQLRTPAVIVTDIEKREVIIVGTAYAGEIKKSVFSLMNYLLPEKNILPMHSGANMHKESGQVSVFFGLSGTGKTTLSTQEGRNLIGDDEHGLSDTGIFNFEGGCYAKMYNITAESEPEIFAASNQFGAILENVVMDQNNIPHFDDKTIAENTRSSYPLKFIKDIVVSGVGPLPKHLFFLSADAFGVLPPVSKLNNSQAMYYFLSGYTAKLAGTEVGIKEPKAAFSTCFGAPFMIRHSGEYAALLGDYLHKHKISVWLINTGWTGGKYGIGKRFPLKFTRRIIDAIQNGELDQAEWHKEEIFGFNIPKNITGVDAKILDPRASWSDGDAYHATATELAKMFHKNFAKFSNIEKTVLDGAPLVK